MIGRYNFFVRNHDTKREKLFVTYVTFVTNSKHVNRDSIWSHANNQGPKNKLNSRSLAMSAIKHLSYVAKI